MSRINYRVGAVQRHGTHPILTYVVKGAVWYQGESNAGGAYKYRTLHPAMIESWRAEFKNPDLAFYFVQLAPWDPKVDPWCARSRGPKQLGRVA